MTEPKYFEFTSGTIIRLDGIIKLTPLRIKKYPSKWGSKEGYETCYFSVLYDNVMTFEPVDYSYNYEVWEWTKEDIKTHYEKLKSKLNILD